MKKITAIFSAVAMTLSMTIAAMPALSISVTAAAPIKVACVGDSITDGTDVVDLVQYNFPNQLQKLLGTENYEVKNFGDGGSAVLKNAFRPYWNQGVYNQSRNYNPDIVIVMLGTNDGAGDNFEKIENFERDYKALLESYINLSSHPTVYVATCPETRDEPRRTNIRAIIPMQKKVAGELGLQVLDMFEDTQTYFDCFTDGLHPNYMGKSYMAQFLYKNVFGGKIYDVEVTANPGATVTSGCFSFVAGTSGKVTIPLPEGEQEIRSISLGKGSVSGTINVSETETAINLVNNENRQNLAYGTGVTAIDQGNKNYNGTNYKPNSTNDGDLNTGWQLNTGETFSEGAAISGTWLGMQFDKLTAVNQVVIWWEAASRCTDQGYTVDYSLDGKTWKAVANMDRYCTKSTDVCTFDAVSVNYIRVNCTKASSKNFPKIFELEVYGASLNYSSADGTVTGFTGETALSQLGDVTAVSSKGVMLEADDLVGTGCVITKDDAEYVAVVMGDVNGDGKIGTADFLMVRDAFLEKLEVSGSYATAAKVSGKSEISTADFLMIRDHFLGKTDIYAA